MSVVIKQAPIEQKPVLERLMQLYLYDLSEVDDAGDLNDQGVWDRDDKYFDLYWDEPGRTPFVIYSDNKIAGFILINEHFNIPENEGGKAIAEFFILRRYRNKGVGKTAAFEIFDKFPGKWEVDVASTHPDSEKFWEKVIREYTNGKFTKVSGTENWKGPIYSLVSSNDLNH